MAATHEVLTEIRHLYERIPHITGLLVATADGLLVAHETRDVEPDTLAAMSAAQLGLAQQLAHATGQGGFLENVTRSTNGYLAVFAAGDTALLTVLATAELNVGRLQHEARSVARRLGRLVAEDRRRTAIEGR